MPLACDRPVFHQHHPVGKIHEVEAMGDDNQRASSSDFLEQSFRIRLRVHVESRNGFVENQDRSLAQDSARETDPLTLSAGQRDTAFTNQRVVTIGQLADEVGGADEASRLHDLFGCSAPGGEGDILRDGSAEKKRFLRQRRYALSQTGDSIVTDIPAIDPDGSGVPLVQTQDEFCNG